MPAARRQGGDLLKLDDLDRLEAAASAFANNVPDANMLLVLPLFQFALHGGKLHGPFIVWGPPDGDKGSDQPRSLKEVREQHPRRFEGAYRFGERHGTFVDHDPTGKVRTRRYDAGRLLS
jgi:hypothetical protein